ncbi:Aminomethyltransferase [Trichinella spiralis]|uniref:Aminomethyltransferase n=1 Tax=Trichinella spiralis TaxID=6334 RepID=A0ABR3L3R6_TRISP
MAAIVVGLEKHHAIAEQLGMAFVTGRPAVGQFSKLISIAVEGRRRWISGRIGRLSLPVPNKPLYSGMYNKRRTLLPTTKHNAYQPV